MPASVAASLHAVRVGHASSAADVSDAKVMIVVVAVVTVIDCTFMIIAVDRDKVDRVVIADQFVRRRGLYKS